MNQTLIRNATIINENQIFKGNVLIQNGKFTQISKDPIITDTKDIIEANGLYLLPGIIDSQVHFREPGLTAKGEIATESMAAVAGGVTSYMEMPNTVPQTTTQTILEEKYKLGADKSYANFSFYMGATNDNLDELLKTNPSNVCGIKVFLGASTGNMLVHNTDLLNSLFANSPLRIAVHCEDEPTIQKNIAIYKEKYGENVPVQYHPYIRSTEACYTSSSFAVALARKHNTRLHILHISTQKELELFDSTIPLSEKRITGEACVHHLWFSEKDYLTKGTHIKWNPAIKTEADRQALLQGVINDKLDVIATDHAPHLLSEKEKPYFNCPSGAPLVQHSLVTMLELYKQNQISLETIVRKMCHAPADLFRIKERGYIRQGYYADCVLVDLQSPWTVTKNNILYKCGWSPLEDTTFQSQIKKTFVNGNLVFDEGTINHSHRGMRLEFIV